MRICQRLFIAACNSGGLKALDVHRLALCEPHADAVALQQLQSHARFPAAGQDVHVPRFARQQDAGGVGGRLDPPAVGEFDHARPRLGQAKRGDLGGGQKQGLAEAGGEQDRDFAFLPVRALSDNRY